MADFFYIRVGDRVWIVKEGERPYLKTVARVTKAQIVIDWHGTGAFIARFNRVNGFRVGGGSFNGSFNRITGLAGPEECASFEEMERQREEEEQRKSEIITARNAKISEFMGWFAAHGDNVCIRQEVTGGWAVEFNNLTNKGVRLLAEATKKVVSPRVDSEE